MKGYIEMEYKRGLGEAKLFISTSQLVLFTSFSNVLFRIKTKGLLESNLPRISYLCSPANLNLPTGRITVDLDQPTSCVSNIVKLDTGTGHLDN
ncbi:hypothetical protein CTI12_AA316560 [Artemisia annua]|uniref:Uncharacterized protein n=1 Tax=Artemisia annua TaxID=35608 RepID=A0A2U1N2P3_ARTAN|nr:hypothetical protein CTI12_AA316560 [Artemisia annua]